MKRALIRLRPRPRPAPLTVAAICVIPLGIGLTTSEFPQISELELHWISRRHAPAEFWFEIKFSAFFVTSLLCIAFLDLPHLKLCCARLIHRGSRIEVPIWVGLIVVIIVGLSVAWGLSALLAAYS